MNELAGMKILVLPDDDDRVKDCLPLQMKSDGVRFYVSETNWEKIRAKFDGLPSTSMSKLSLGFRYEASKLSH